MRPVLEAASKHERKISDVVGEMEIAFNLTDEEKEERLPSGKQTTIANRTHWAKSYLKQAGLVMATRRGWYIATTVGRDVARDTSTKIDSKFLERFDDFLEFKDRRAPPASNANPPPIANAVITPDEQLQAAYESLNSSLAAALLESARNVSPAFFESLLVELFVSMGYGGNVIEAGRALGQTGDNGVDGVIDQDPLGVDQIFIQAKRYAANNAVGASEIRDFFGALNLKKASKGIFVTTSRFTAAAKATAQNLGTRIVLIDGPQLADLMVAYNIGCLTKETLHIKDIDESFFEEN